MKTDLIIFFRIRYSVGLNGNHAKWFSDLKLIKYDGWENWWKYRKKTRNHVERSLLKRIIKPLTRHDRIISLLKQIPNALLWFQNSLRLLDTWRLMKFSPCFYQIYNWMLYRCFAIDFDFINVECILCLAFPKALLGIWIERTMTTTKT